MRITNVGITFGKKLKNWLDSPTTGFKKVVLLEEDNEDPDGIDFKICDNDVSYYGVVISKGETDRYLYITNEDRYIATLIQSDKNKEGTPDFNETCLVRPLEYYYK